MNSPSSRIAWISGGRGLYVAWVFSDENVAGSLKIARMSSWRVTTQKPSSSLKKTGCSRRARSRKPNGSSRSNGLKSAATSCIGQPRAGAAAGAAAPALSTMGRPYEVATGLSTAS